MNETEKKEVPVEKKEAKKKAPRKKVETIKVKVKHPRLIIRKGPGTNYEKTGKHVGLGVFEINKIEPGEGSKSGFGKLKSGKGWISLDYTERV